MKKINYETFEEAFFKLLDFQQYAERPSDYRKNFVFKALIKTTYKYFEKEKMLPKSNLEEWLTEHYKDNEIGVHRIWLKSKYKKD